MPGDAASPDEVIAGLRELLAKRDAQVTALAGQLEELRAQVADLTARVTDLTARVKQNSKERSEAARASGCLPHAADAEGFTEDRALDLLRTV